MKIVECILMCAVFSKFIHQYLIRDYFYSTFKYKIIEQNVPTKPTLQPEQPIKLNNNWFKP